MKKRIGMCVAFPRIAKASVKPMHTQPIYLSHDFINRNGSGRGQSNAYIDEGEEQDVGMDIFRRGLCLPSDNKMTVEEQDKIIEVIHRAFE